MSAIPFHNFPREYTLLKKELDDAFTRVMKHGVFILGPEVEHFESLFAAYNGVRYGIGVNSGTDALYLSLLAAGIGAGDEVILPVNTEVATALAVVMSGARPVFVDCDASFLIDSETVSHAVRKKTKAIIPVHLYGNACDLDRLAEIAREHNLILIEDCAQAAGAKWRGKKVGSVGDLGCFSFYPTKTLGGYGDGGMVLTNNEAYAEKIRALRYRGQPDKIHSIMFGVNSRLDELHAAFLSVKLSYLDSWNARRQSIAAQYRELLHDTSLILPVAEVNSVPVYHLFVVRSQERDQLRERLKERGIDTLIHYPIPLHEQPFFTTDSTDLFPNATTYAQEILSLPLHPHLTDEEVREIATAVQNSV